MQRTSASGERSGAFERFPDNLSGIARGRPLRYAIHEHPELDFSVNNLPRRPVGAHHETVSIFPVLPLLSAVPSSPIFIPYGRCFLDADGDVRKLILDGAEDPQYDYYCSRTGPLPAQPLKSAATLNHRRMNESEGLGEAMARVHALLVPTSTRLEMVAGIANTRDELGGCGVLEHVMLRIRRVTAIFTDSEAGLGIEFEDTMYQYTLAQFISQRNDPSPFSGLFYESNDTDQLWWFQLWNQLWSITVDDARRVRARAHHQGLVLPTIVWRRMRDDKDIPKFGDMYVQMMYDTNLSTPFQLDECSVCMEAFTDDRPYVVTDCAMRHGFCSHCLREFVHKSRFEPGDRPCPLCRCSLPNAKVYKPWERDTNEFLRRASPSELHEHLGIAGMFDASLAVVALQNYFAENPCAGVLGQMPHNEIFAKLMQYDYSRTTVPAYWKDEYQLGWDFDYAHRYRRTIILALQLRSAMRRAPDGTLAIVDRVGQALPKPLHILLETAEHVWAKQEIFTWSMRKFELRDKFSSFRPPVDDVEAIDDRLSIFERMSSFCCHIWNQMRRRRLAFEGLNRAMAGTEDLWSVMDHFPLSDATRDDETFGGALPMILSDTTMPHLMTRLRRIQDARRIPVDDAEQWAMALTNIIVACGLPPDYDAQTPHDDHTFDNVVLDEDISGEMDRYEGVLCEDGSDECMPEEYMPEEYMSEEYMPEEYMSEWYESNDYDPDEDTPQEDYPEDPDEDEAEDHKAEDYEAENFFLNDFEAEEDEPSEEDSGEDTPREDEPDTEYKAEAKKLGKTEPNKNKITKPATTTKATTRKGRKEMLRKMAQHKGIGSDDDGEDFGEAPKGNFYELIWLCLGLQPCNDEKIQERYEALRRVWRRRGWLSALEAMQPSRQFILRRAADLFKIIYTLLDDPAMCKPPFYYEVGTFADAVANVVYALRNEDTKPLDEQVAVLNKVWDDVNNFINGTSKLGASFTWRELVEEDATMIESDSLLDDVIRHMRGEAPLSEIWDPALSSEPDARHPNPLRNDDTFVYATAAGGGRAEFHVQAPRVPLKLGGVDWYLGLVCKSLMWTTWNEEGADETVPPSFAYVRHEPIGGPWRDARDGRVFQSFSVYLDWLFGQAPQDERPRRLGWL